jgi:hypothetical protein
LLQGCWLVWLLWVINHAAVQQAPAWLLLEQRSLLAESRKHCISCRGLQTQYNGVGAMLVCHKQDTSCVLDF